MNKPRTRSLGPMKPTFLPAIQRRAARVAVGASAARGQGAPGLVLSAREFLAELPLGQFGVSDARLFRRRLDAATERLKRRLPARGRSWGIARKLLNIFLRDALYTRYLEEANTLRRAEAYLEVPLDSITAGRMRAAVPRGSLPRWSGVRHLTVEASDLFQAAALAEAKRYGVARVHLDALWWGVRPEP